MLARRWLKAHGRQSGVLAERTLLEDIIMIATSEFEVSVI